MLLSFQIFSILICISCLSIAEQESNYPPVIRRYILAQAQEVARQCVEAPKRRQKIPFVKRPSLLPVMKFILETIHQTPTMKCGMCDSNAFSDDPSVSVIVRIPITLMKLLAEFK